MSDTPETAEYWKQRHEDLGEMARQDREELTATIEQLQAEVQRLKADQAGWGICPDCGCCSYVPAPAQEPTP